LQTSFLPSSLARNQQYMLWLSSPRSAIQCEWYLLRTSLSYAVTSVMQYMLWFSSPRRLAPRAAALGHSHGVLFDVVVMSSMLDYYLSCIYRCIALQPNILSTLIICSLSQ
jgi:hypothetical protein